MSIIVFVAGTCGSTDVNLQAKQFEFYPFYWFSRCTCERYVNIINSETFICTSDSALNATLGPTSNATGWQTLILVFCVSNFRKCPLLFLRNTVLSRIHRCRTVDTTCYSYLLERNKNALVRKSANMWDPLLYNVNRPDTRPFYLGYIYISLCLVCLVA